jgi:hypothetical protein
VRTRFPGVGQHRPRESRVDDAEVELESTEVDVDAVLAEKRRRRQEILARYSKPACVLSSLFKSYRMLRQGNARHCGTERSRQTPQARLAGINSPSLRL